VPKGKKQEITTLNVIQKFQFLATATLTVFIKNIINSAPCTGPIALVSPGLSKKYFNGIATNIKANKEKPSKKPSIRNRPRFVLNNCIILSEI
jgi:hypothetical protein